MNAKGKAGATAGKRQRTAQGAKSGEGAPKKQCFNSSGESSSIRVSRAGRDSDELRDEDWNFSRLAKKDHATLRAACWYEYARESQHVRKTMRDWLALQKVRERLRPYVRDIFKDFAHEGRVLRGNPDSIVVDDTNWEDLAEYEMLPLAFYRDKRLPRPLCKAVDKLHGAEKAVQKIESKAGVGAPRLRLLAKYLVRDEPWLRIPIEHQHRAISTAFANRFEVPGSAEGVKHFRAKRAFERVNWCNFIPPHFGDGDLRKNGVSKDLHHREITTRADAEATGLDERGEVVKKTSRSAGDEVLPVLICWGAFNDKEIIADFTSWVKSKRGRPNEWKERAKDSGRGRVDGWRAALKELAAMRLMHSLPLQNVKEDDLGARETFRDAFDPGARFDDAALARLRRNAVRTFAHFFPFGESPKRAETFDSWLRGR